MGTRRVPTRGHDQVPTMTDPPDEANAKERRRNWKLLLAYDGSDFCGWQVQLDQPTIQGRLSDAIERITGERVLLCRVQGVPTPESMLSAR